jgi:preprotein translocase subunit SecG
VNAVRIALLVVVVVTSLFQTILILLHKAKGGGLSDMFGGGVSASLGGSSYAERNLNRFTIAIALVWSAAIIGVGLIERFSPTL